MLNFLSFNIALFIKKIMHILHRQHLLMGVFYACLSALCFALMSIVIKLIGERASTDTIVFARFSMSLLFILPWIVKSPKALFKEINFFRLASRTFSSLLSIACFFYALKYLSLTDALLLNNTAPIFVPIILALTHRISTPWGIWLGIGVGFIGIAFVLKPQLAFLQPATLIGLASGIFSAISYVLIRFLTKAHSITQILFYNFLLSTFISALFLPLDWVSFDREVLFLLVLMGLLGCVYQFFFTYSLAKAPIRITSSLSFLAVVLGAIADFVIWNQAQDFYDWMGITCVILGGILVIYFGKKEFK